MNTETDQYLTSSNSRSDLIVGIEIGSSKMAVVVAEHRESGELRILGHGRSTSRGVRNGAFVDLEVASKMACEAIVDAEDACDVMIKRVNLAVTGSYPKIQTADNVRCINLVGVEVERTIFSAQASAEAVLDLKDKDSGVLVIDMGGGTTNYAVYENGALRLSDCVLIAGDRITHGLEFGLKIPRWRAERLKIDESDVRAQNGMQDERMLLGAERNFEGIEVERAALNQIVSCRAREILALVREQLEKSTVQLNALSAGLYITGGCSMLRGIEEVAQDVFGLPSRLARIKGGLYGASRTINDPQNACAIGLIKMAAQPK